MSHDLALGCFGYLLKFCAGFACRCEESVSTEPLLICWARKRLGNIFHFASTCFASHAPRQKMRKAATAKKTRGNFHFSLKLIPAKNLAHMAWEFYMPAFWHVFRPAGNIKATAGPRLNWGFGNGLWIGGRSGSSRHDKQRSGRPSFHTSYSLSCQILDYH